MTKIRGSPQSNKFIRKYSFGLDIDDTAGHAAIAQDGLGNVI